MSVKPNYFFDLLEKFGRYAIKRGDVRCLRWACEKADEFLTAELCYRFDRAMMQEAYQQETNELEEIVFPNIA